MLSMQSTYYTTGCTPQTDLDHENNIDDVGNYYYQPNTLVHCIQLCNFIILVGIGRHSFIQT